MKCPRCEGFTTVLHDPKLDGPLSRSTYERHGKHVVIPCPRCQFGTPSYATAHSVSGQKEREES